MKEDIKILSEEEIQEKLKDFPGWEYKDNKISKEFEFEAFMDCVAFIVKLAPFSEANDHHPDIHIFYKKILFELQRFDVGGKVTAMDFKVAEEIERLYKRYKKD
jgi:4a-hydroxytetrahydrobiopterin dehydratase